MRIRDTVSAARAIVVPLTVLVRLVVVAAVAATAMAATAPAPAAAASAPCWKQVINDWFDGKIDRVYPIHCYREAIAQLPEDAEQYSDAAAAIRAAMLEAIRGGRDNGGTQTDGGGSATGPDDPGAPGADEDDAGGDGDGGGAAPRAGGGGDGDGFIGDLLNLVGPRNADSIPLPLLVLAGIALLLLAAAAASFVARRVQARRVPVPTPPDGRPRS
jgi:hypothetical protein